MKATTVFACLLAVVSGVPVHRSTNQYILQQAKQRPQLQANPSQEAVQELAQRILEQYARMFQSVNIAGVKSQNQVLNTPQLVLPPGTPLETPPQVDPLGTNQQGVSAQPGLIGDVPVQPMTQAPEPGTEVFVPAGPNEQDTQAGLPVLVPVQPNTWGPQSGVPFLLPLPPNTQGIQPTDQPGLQAQLPQMFPPFRFLPVFPSQTGNQQFPGYGMPLFFPTGYPQLPVQPAETAQTAQSSLPVLPVQPAQATQPGQQQIPQIFYMIRQPMAGPFGSASSEELQGAGTMGGFGMFLPGFGGVASAGVNSVNPGGLPAGQGVDPAAGADPVPNGAPPTTAVLSAGLEMPLAKDTAGGLVENPLNTQMPPALD